PLGRIVPAALDTATARSRLGCAVSAVLRAARCGASRRPLGARTALIGVAAATACAAGIGLRREPALLLARVLRVEITGGTTALGSGVLGHGVFLAAHGEQHPHSA